jgi:hypothetical protein
MRRGIWLGALVLALTLVLPAGSASASIELPFRTTFYGSGTGMEGPEGCPPGSAYRIHNAGWGYSTYLGRFTWSSVHCTIFGSNPPMTVTLTDGHMTYVASNGDELYAEYGEGYVSELSPTWACIDDEATFIGGTGRFVHASGDSHEHGCFDPRQVPEGLMIIRAVGSISFDASDRAA